MIDRHFLKESGFGAVVLFQLCDRGNMAEVLLGNILIIKVEIVLQSGFQMPGRGEGGGFKHFGDATVEALDHAVGLRVFGLDQAMLDAMRGTRLIEHMLASGFALAGGTKAVGKLLAVIGQHGANAERRFGVQAFQEAGGGVGAVLSG